MFFQLNKWQQIKSRRLKETHHVRLENGKITQTSSFFRDPKKLRNKNRVIEAAIGLSSSTKKNGGTRLEKVSKQRMEMRFEEKNLASNIDQRITGSRRFGRK
ncbi:hypothetical protein TNIN_478061 [Trichonephila inaurata madagascariensis]|uniref:Uncharacterized protein n=1 Tax=Trichonephila inaurata madagascariensis TaxID=2747483 RepID=A0A8X7BYJ5_9ARAC|nr:hypothetical protein TNIN_478061 [Trichonephila inaurata madagascariensis]